MAYEYIEFPKYIYHKTKEPKIVNSKEEQAAEGDEWSETSFEKEIISEEKVSEVIEQSDLAEEVPKKLKKGSK